MKSLLLAIVMIVICNSADACVEVYRIDKHGERHFVRTEYCHKEECPHFQKWSNAKIEKVYENDVAPAPKVNRSATAEIEMQKEQPKKKQSAGIKIVNVWRSIFGKKKI